MTKAKTPEELLARMRAVLSNRLRLYRDSSGYCRQHERAFLLTWVRLTREQRDRVARKLPEFPF